MPFHHLRSLIAVCLSHSVILESDPQQVVHRVALRVTNYSIDLYYAVVNVYLPA